jgi:hypothetical protein
MVIAKWVGIVQRGEERRDHEGMGAMDLIR